MSLYKLFFEIVQMMGMRGYNIHPFKSFINNHMKNERFLELGLVDKINEINDQDLINWIINYRTTNFGISPEHFNGPKMQISLIFDHPNTGMRTLVLVSNDIEGSTSKDTIVDYNTRILKLIVQNKTNGESFDPFLLKNKVNGIFILPKGVSSYSKKILNEISFIKIITEEEILSRCYDSVIQSHISVVSNEEKLKILEPVGLNGSKIPGIISQDPLCKILDLKKNCMMICTRSAISQEETIEKSIYFRNII